MLQECTGERLEQCNYTAPKSSAQLSSVMNQPLLSQENPIQLAAICNYKLAQLTFSAPDLNSMRKTALIKNMAEFIYTDTPPEWLDQMRRWQFFTPESLNDMTQDGLEQIFGQYIQTMEAFKPINLNEEDDDDDDDLWADEEILTPNDHQLELNGNISTSSTTVPVMMEYPLYSHSGASLSGDLLYQKDFKPLPDRPTTTDFNGSNNSVSATTTTATVDDKQRRKSMAKMRNRLSWTSDTGLSSNSAVAQTWANELMTMFNMEFQVDTSLTLNTAPTLPELPFSSRHNQQKRRSRKSQRYSTDSFMNLIPAFESFDLEEPDRRASTINRSRNMTFPPPPLSTPPPPSETPGFTSSRRRSASQPVMPMDTNQNTNSKPGPTRSSSLKYKSQSAKSIEAASASKHRSTDILNGFVNAFSGGEKSLSKKKSIRRLAALVTGTNSNNTANTDNNNNSNKHRPSSSSSTLSPRSSSNRKSTTSSIYQSPSSPTSNTYLSATQNASRLSIASTSTMSSTNSVLMVATKTPLTHFKPLPDTPQGASSLSSTSLNNTHKSTEIKRRTSYAMARPVVVEVSDLRRSRSVGYRPKKKRKSLRTSASIKRKSGSLSKSSSTTNNTIRTAPNDLIPPVPSTATCTSEPSPSPSTLLSSPLDESLPASSSSKSLNEQLLMPSAAASANPIMTTSFSSSTVSSATSTSTSASLSSRSPSSTSLPSVSLAPPQPKRSKSALMKLGSGLTKGHKKAQRQNSSSSTSTPSTVPSASSSSSTPDMEIDMAEVNFVKRMASLGKRMKLQRV